jgi:hypothetical protein
MTMTLPASATNPRTDPAWTFDIYIPGKSLPKGSQVRKGRFLGDPDHILEWVAICAAHAIKERNIRRASGDTSFPYEERVKLWPLFVFDRPKRGTTDSPTSSNKYGDLDKLIRSVGDALAPGQFYLKSRSGYVSKAAVMADDSLITRMGEPAKVFSDETIQHLPAGAYLHLERAPDNKIDGELYGWRPGSV